MVEFDVLAGHIVLGGKSSAIKDGSVKIEFRVRVENSKVDAIVLARGRRHELLVFPTPSETIVAAEALLEKLKGLEASEHLYRDDDVASLNSARYRC
jgi:hypothetical protein